MKDIRLKEPGATTEDKQIGRNSKPGRKLSTTLPKIQEEGPGVRINAACVGSVPVAPTHTATATFPLDTSFPPPPPPPPYTSGTIGEEEENMETVQALYSTISDVNEIINVP